MILPYNTLRILNWVFEFLTSSLGITAFISLISSMMPTATIDSCLTVEERMKRVKENDRRLLNRKRYIGTV